MTNRNTTLLGLFFITAIGTLGYYTVFMTDFSLFKDLPELTVHFSEARGLREGDSVQVAGLRWGRVKKISYDHTAVENRRITTVLQLDKDIQLRTGFKIQIADATLLGGHNVLIDPGPADAEPIPAEKMLMGSILGNPFDAIGELFGREGGHLDRILVNIDGILADARAGKGLVGRMIADEGLAESFSSGVTNASSALYNVDRIASGIYQGKGTVGQLFNERALYDNMVASSDRVRVISDDLSSITQAAVDGNGLVNRVFFDETLGESTASVVERTSTALGLLVSSEGTLGLLLNDPTIAQNLSVILDTTAKGEGTLGALLMRSEIYEDAARFMDNLALVSEALRDADGSLGRFIMDDALYEEARKALGIVTSSLEEFREAAPVTTFTSVLFGAF